MIFCHFSQVSPSKKGKYLCQISFHFCLSVNFSLNLDPDWVGSSVQQQLVSTKLKRNLKIIKNYELTLITECVQLLSHEGGIDNRRTESTSSCCTSEGTNKVCNNTMENRFLVAMSNNTIGNRF